MKRLLFAAGAVWALSVVCSSDVLAQHNHFRSSSPGGYSSPRLSVSVGHRNVGVNRSNNSGFRQFQGYQGSPVYGGRAHQTWHDTSHLHYHGPSVVPHRGHLDYLPGHYDLHRTGHWDRLRH